MQMYKTLVGASVIALSGSYLFRRWAAGGVVPEKFLKNENLLKGKVVLITGANTGIGFETAKVLTSLGAHTILACRNEKNAKEAIDRIRNHTKNGQLQSIHLDLSDLDSVKQCAEDFRSKNLPLDILINNAGVYCDFGKTKQGFEIMFGTNHIGHFVLTNLLLDKVQESGGRIITVSSRAHQRGNIDFDTFTSSCKEGKLSGMLLYSQSKLANIFFTNELQRRLDKISKEKGKKEVTCVCLHPGVVATEFFRNINAFALLFVGPLLNLCCKTSHQGAQTSIYCAVYDKPQELKGRYLSDCKPVESSPLSRDEAIARKLWEVSEQLTEKYIQKDKW